MKPKKKVGILTFHNAYNYGAILQSYALTTYINTIGVKSELVRYNSSAIDKRYNKYITKGNVKKKATFLFKRLLLGYMEKNKKEKFKNFTQKHTFVSEKAYGFSEELVELNDSYSHLIVGSDQVWNLSLTEKDTAFLFDFETGNLKLASYAASVGHEEINDDEKKIFKEHLRKFDMISIREQKTASMISEILPEKDVEVNCDPVFLLPKEEWEKIAIVPKEKDYILVYLLQASNEAYEFVKNLSKHTQKEVVVIATGLSKKLKARYLYDLGPEEFVGYFLNASHVITNSFHGVSFSILFNKEYYFELLKVDSRTNLRLNNIVKLFGHEDRNIANTIGITDRLDSEAINLRISNEIARADKYLKTFIYGS